MNQKKINSNGNKLKRKFSNEKTVNVINQKLKGLVIGRVPDKIDSIVSGTYGNLVLDKSTKIFLFITIKQFAICSLSLQFSNFRDIIRKNKKDINR